MLKALAANPNSDVGVMKAVADLVPGALHLRDGQQAFAAGIELFKRQDAPHELLLAVLDDPRTTTQFRKVAARETTHEAVREALARDRSEVVRRAAARGGEGSE